MDLLHKVQELLFRKRGIAHAVRFGCLAEAELFLVADFSIPVSAVRVAQNPIVNPRTASGVIPKLGAILSAAERRLSAPESTISLSVSKICIRAESEAGPTGISSAGVRLILIQSDTLRSAGLR